MAITPRSRTLLTVRQLAIGGTALLALAVIGGGVHLGSDGYERWTPEREMTQPLGGIAAGFIDAPRHHRAAGQEEPVATAVEGEAAPEARVPPGPTLIETPEAATPVALAAGADAKSTIDLATPPPVLPPTVEDLPTRPDLPGSARPQEQAQGATRRAEAPPKLGVEKIDKPADATPWIRRGHD